MEVLGVCCGNQVRFGGPYTVRVAGTYVSMLRLQWGLARGAVATCTLSVVRAGLRHMAGFSAGPLASLVSRPRAVYLSSRGRRG